MCLAIPGKVLEIKKGTTPLMGIVSFGGIQKEICLDWVDDVKVDEYVIVHVGFALSKMDEKEAMITLNMIEEMEKLGDESKQLGKEE
ncbi:MAG: HypC/HybG/HupF family hydrogenase formation chaperone [Chlorobiaceae bacterium]|nr:HypC/HybG/HupF family hydrogenase formation chaperone [Chlorobiaceae bacterium]